MTRLLDARTSQNASFYGENSQSVADQTILIGQIGLSTLGYEGIIRVQLSGICSFLDISNVFKRLTLFVVRGTEPTDPLVASNALEISIPITTNVYQFSIIASDYDPVPADELVYSLFVRGEVFGQVAIIQARGLQSFNGAAYSD